MSNLYYPQQQQRQPQSQLQSYNPISKNQQLPYQPYPLIPTQQQMQQQIQQQMQQQQQIQQQIPQLQQMQQQRQQFPQMPISPHHEMTNLKKQASLLRSQYPLTQWCYVYVQQGSQNDDSKMPSPPIDNQNMYALRQIPKTQTQIDMDIENEIMGVVESIKESDEQKINDIKSWKLKKEKEKTEKIATLKEISNLKDDNDLRVILEGYNWNVDDAISSQFASPDTKSNQNNLMNDEFNYNFNNIDNKLTLKVILPDTRQFSYQMSEDQTFWNVYSEVVQSASDLTQTMFYFQLPNGLKIAESAFDQTLKQNKLTSNGVLKVVIDSV